MSDVSRRDFLLKLGIGLNVLAGAMISIPLIGYVMSSFVKKLPLKWTSLGPVDKFREGSDDIGDLRESLSSRVGRRSRCHSLLGPTH